MMSAIFVVCLVLGAATEGVLGYDSALYEDMLFQDLYKRLSQMDDSYYPLYSDQQNAWDENEIIPLDSRDSGQTNIRDPEYLAHSSNSDGFQYISGGAGEGEQRLTPEGTQENTQEVKSDDILPFYCHPPNPCPKGFTEDDGCQLNVLDSAESQKEWISSLQSKGMCSCDEEHMFDCASKTGLEEEFINSVLGGGKDEYKNPFYGGESNMKLVAKKSPRIRRSVHMSSDKKDVKGLKFSNKNPYLQGNRIRMVAKKGMHL